MNTNATVVVREALEESGIELVASCSADAYDAVAPAAFQSCMLMPGARGLVVAGSAGPALWLGLRARLEADRLAAGLRPPRSLGNPREVLQQEHPIDRFVGAILARADAALAMTGVRFRRFDAAFDSTPRMDFLAMARLVGLGSPGPFGMLIHDVYGPWWALRGAWLVDEDVDPPLHHRGPCTGCAAPCVGGMSNAGGVALATVQVRSRCVVGQQSRYDDDQIAYHYERFARLGAPDDGDG